MLFASTDTRADTLAGLRLGKGVFCLANPHCGQFAGVSEPLIGA
jgi:hypothetical protein